MNEYAEEEPEAKTETRFRVGQIWKQGRTKYQVVSISKKLCIANLIDRTGLKHEMAPLYDTSGWKPIK